MRPGYCSIRWSQNTGIYSFTVTGDTYTAVGDGTVGTSASALSGTMCTTDFVVIPNPMSSTTGIINNADRFCGNGFNTVTSKGLCAYYFRSI